MIEERLQRSRSAETTEKSKSSAMESHVDPFLVEALQNPRLRLTVLRMELDIQKFMRDSSQNQFKFQQFPTSYLRRAAHLAAQHYGLQTFSVDNVTNSLSTLGGNIIAIKTPYCKFPAMCLSEVPAKHTESGICIADQVKIAIHQRPSNTSLIDVTERDSRKSPVRTMEERKEEYEKARARIFNSSSYTDAEDFSSVNMADRRRFSSSGDEIECYISSGDGNEKARAIFRDREKDRQDPDYDRSYNRYVKGHTPSQNLGLEACNFVQAPFLQYEACPPVGLQLLRNQTPVAYRPMNPAVCPQCAFGSNQIPSENAVYTMPWPTPQMMYAQSYGHFRHAIFQALDYQHSLSFGHSSNC